MRPMTARFSLSFGLAFSLVFAGSTMIAAEAAAAEQEAGTVAGERSDWQTKKCDVYAKALAEILEHVGREGVSERFLAQNQAFIDSGCLADVDACPESEAEIEIANGLTIATMNAGAASSFSPFRCRG
ncbi:hypothetical protein [Rhizobium rosettiformans]|uniref:hypothetical protein n=1 Tax=Rhizobium rosettiformans TaxID=1368430 RepID=UPI002861B778|nr:hypothetical protein [Rhizobium rosettiformans]MDR7026706.1 hypothetical protein [Rhizobium rosettiformans]MDR7064827.1 hypothetical protein [Rhizobium rosettiformans]